MRTLSEAVIARARNLSLQEHFWPEDMDFGREEYDKWNTDDNRLSLEDKKAVSSWISNNVGKYVRFKNSAVDHLLADLSNEVVSGKSYTRREQDWVRREAENAVRDYGRR